MAVRDAGSGILTPRSTDAGDADDTGWWVLNRVVNQMEDTGLASYQHVGAGFRVEARKIHGVVHLRGHLWRDPAAAANDPGTYPCLWLPERFQPERQMYVVVSGANDPANFLDVLGLVEINPSEVPNPGAPDGEYGVISTFRLPRNEICFDGITYPYDVTLGAS